MSVYIGHRQLLADTEPDERAWHPRASVAAVGEFEEPLNSLVEERRE
jgi:hypothetical protein